jgi:hypothetical protein
VQFKVLKEEQELAGRTLCQMTALTFTSKSTSEEKFFAFLLATADVTFCTWEKCKRREKIDTSVFGRYAEICKQNYNNIFVILAISEE